MGRFLSPDPSVLLYADPTNPQTLNLYSYGLNNPLTNSDPSGLSCITLTHDGGTSEQGDDGDGQGCAAAGIAGDGTVDTNRRDSVSVNGNNGSSQPLSSTLQTAGYLLAWVNGAGAFVPTIEYGPNTLGTKDMRNTGTVKRAIQAYKDAGCPAAGGKLNSGSGFNGHFGPWQETRDDMLTGMPNPTQAEVGGYTGSIVNNGDGTDTMSIDNTTGLASLTGVSTYAPGATKAVDTAGSLMGMPPMKQHFHWTQQDPCHN